MVNYSISLVNYNAKDLTEKCIKSICKKTENISLEIVLVDNNSSDNSCELIKEEFPQIKIIENKQNKGFAYANNQAIKMASGKYIMLLNNDTVLKNDALDKMAAFLDNNPKVGAVTCKLFDADGKTIQRNCRTFPSPFGTFFGRASFLTKISPNNPWSSKNLLSDWDYNSVKEIDWASGAALMVRREVIEQVGVLDDKNFFIYWEDTDWCKRIRDAGWKIMFIPDAEIIHLTGQGGGKRGLWLSNIMIYQMHKSAYNYFKKHYFKSRLSFMRFFVFCGFISLTILKICLNSIKMFFK